MKSMRAVPFLLTPVLAAFTLHAQADLFKQAPPDVDLALRARVKKFYQAYVDGKHRTAMPMVAEDTQDLWFDSDKPKYLSFELLTIKYADDFRKANVTVVVEQEMKQRFGHMMSKVPTSTTWRIDDGQWVYYVDKAVRGTKETPFGTMKAGAGGDSSQSGLSRLTDKSQIAKGVWLDKGEVHLGDSDEVVVTNGLPGEVHLILETDQLEGLTGKLDQATLAPNGKAKVRFEYVPTQNAPTKALQARIIVRETQQTIPVDIKFR
jgi:hypothetical protein